MFRAALIAVFCLLLSGAAAAQVDSRPKVVAKLVPEDLQVAPGQTVSVALEENIRPGWHTYWINPGDAGAPTEIQWLLPPGWHAGPIRWPYPKRLPVGPLMNYGYEGRTWLLVDLSVPSQARVGDRINLKAAVSWLVCKDVCIPENTILSVPFEIVQAPLSPDARGERTFALARAQLPVPSPWPSRYRLSDELQLFVAAPMLSKAKPVSAEFFPLSGHALKMSAVQTLAAVPGGILLTLVPSKRFRTGASLAGVLVLRSIDGSVQALSIDAAQGLIPETAVMSDSDMPVALALLFAFLGGLILNLMPCVLPVLAMKAIALSRHSLAEADAIRRDSLYYAAGAIVTFVSLGLLLNALRASGAAIGWGFQLQEPIVVAGFALLMFAVGLNLSGVYEINPVTVGESLTRRSGGAGAFFTGVLAVGVAAPCTAPFMAAAIGFALAQSAMIVLSTFLALGAGFALPVMFLALIPGTALVLPRPGAWMVTLRQALAFPMYAAVAWLVWVLSRQVNASGLAAALTSLLFFAFSMWLWSTTRVLTSRGRALGTLATLVGLIVCFSFLATLRQGERAPPSTPTAFPGASEPYSTAKLAALRAAGRPVFVDVTAAWCITCLVNEETVLTRPDIRDDFNARRVMVLVADWTSRNPEITRLLEENGRSGVPFYLYYRPGANSPDVLPQILTGPAITSVLQGGTVRH